MEASTSSGESGSPLASVGFSRQAWILRRVVAADLDHAELVGQAIGWRIAATVTPAPVSMCWRTMWLKSMR